MTTTKQQVIVASSSLLKAAQKVSAVISNTNALPILDNILFRAEADKCILSATNLNTTLISEIPTEKLNEPFEIAIPAKNLIEILANLEEQPLKISMLYSEVKQEETPEQEDAKEPEENNEENETEETETKQTQPIYSIEISCDNGKFQLTCFDAADFPVLPEIVSDYSFEIEAKKLKEGLSKVSFATGTDELRPVMSCVLFENKETLKLVATDAHKLAVHETGLKINCPDFLMPKEVIKLMERNANEGNVKFTLTKQEGTGMEVEQVVETEEKDEEGSETQAEEPQTEKKFIPAAVSYAKIEMQGLVIIACTMQERYPNYSAVIPSKESGTNILRAKRNDLLFGVRSAMVTSNKTTHQVAFKLNGECEIFSEDLDFGNNTKLRISAEHTIIGGLDELVIGFNGNYLKSVLEKCDEDVALEMSAPNRAAVIRNEKTLYLVMPVMLNQ